MGGFRSKIRLVFLFFVAVFLVDSALSSHQYQSNNPFVFEDHHFTTRLETELGSFRVLQKFTDRSELFQGIENYRVGFLTVEPQTFVVPTHWDAEALLFFANGEGTISLINPESRQSFNIKRGDIFRVPAGISVYLINHNNNQQLVVAKILRSAFAPGELETFVGVGGDNEQSSFFSAFSTEVLEAAFDVKGDEIERLFWPRKQEQEQGFFKNATEEQIRALSDEEGVRRFWPFGERKGPYNIFKKDPSVANNNGNLHDVNSNDYSELRNINVAVSLFNIAQGSMAGPFYNTKATTILVVPKGEGEFDMACPHLAEQSDEQDSGISYERVSSRLRKGTVVVVPPGHPLVLEASGAQNLEVIAFGLNADENQWFPLAGRNNLISQWEDAAVELTFGRPATEVKKVTQKQKQRFFFNGPQRRGRASV